MRPIPPGFENSETIRKALDEITKKPAFRASSAELDRLLEAEIRWLLIFAEVDLASDTHWERLAVRVHRCALRLVGFGQVWPSSVLTPSAPDEGGLLLLPGWGAVPAEFPPLPSEAEIRALQLQVRETLHAFWPMTGKPAKHRITIPAGIQHVYLSNDGREIQRTYGADWPDWFWVGIAALLEKFGSHVERCQAPDCGGLFLRIRRQAYCCAECSQRVRSRRWYEEHREKARERRRDAYERQIRQKYPRAKLASRRAARSAATGRSAITSRRTK